MASKKFPEAESDGTATQPRLVPYPRPVLKESVPTPAAAAAAAAVVVAASAAAAAAAATGPGTECTLAAEAGGDAWHACAALSRVFGSDQPSTCGKAQNSFFRADSRLARLMSELFSTTTLKKSRMYGCATSEGLAACLIAALAMAAD